MKSSKSTEWSDRAVSELFEYIDLNEKKNLDKVRSFIKQLRRDPVAFAMGSERLKGELSGFYSRRINKKDRFVFSLRTEGNEPNIFIASIKNHY